MLSNILKLPQIFLFVIKYLQIYNFIYNIQLFLIKINKKAQQSNDCCAFSIVPTDTNTDFYRFLSL